MSNGKKQKAESPGSLGRAFRNGRNGLGVEVVLKAKRARSDCLAALGGWCPGAQGQD